MDAYEPLETIGHGSFGVIRKVRRISDGKILARKEINYSKMTEKEKMQLVSEVNILRELRHPNIVRYYERYVDKENQRIYIVTEYCENGDLASHIKRHRKERKYMDEETIWRYFTQIVCALHECHSFKGGAVLHRDLKPENIFLLDNATTLRLGDFGLSRVLDTSTEDLARTYVGTPFYMAPEQVTAAGYDAKSDIWSLGCLLYEMCTLLPPFDGPNQTALSAKIKQGRYAPLPPHFSKELQHLVDELLQTDPEKRPTCAQLLEHHRLRFCLRERRILQHLTSVKRREEDLAKREAEVAKREQSLDAREQMVLERERTLVEREMAVAQSERALVIERKRQYSSRTPSSQLQPSVTTPTAAQSHYYAVNVPAVTSSLAVTEQRVPFTDLYSSRVPPLSNTPSAQGTPTSHRRLQSSNTDLTSLARQLGRLEFSKLAAA